MKVLAGAPRRHFEQATSTNELAAQWAREGAPHGAVVTASCQSAGRGRRGRDWSSPPDKGLYLSQIVRPGPEFELDGAQVPQLTMLAALAASDAVREMLVMPARVKWPNDILLHGKKIGGVLSEAEWKSGALDFAVIGLGLNVNFSAEELPERPIFPASSLLLESGREWEIEAVGEAVVSHLQVLLTRYQRGEWETLRTRFAALCEGLGRRVRVQTAQETFSGFAAAIDSQGLLIVHTESGSRAVTAGDVDFE